MNYYALHYVYCAPVVLFILARKLACRGVWPRRLIWALASSAALTLVFAPVAWATGDIVTYVPLPWMLLDPWRTYFYWGWPALTYVFAFVVMIGKGPGEPEAQDEQSS